MTTEQKEGEIISITPEHNAPELTELEREIAHMLAYTNNEPMETDEERKKAYQKYTKNAEFFAPILMDKARNILRSDSNKNIMMTTEQKAAAYDEALELAKSYHDDPNCLKHMEGCLEHIFPELAESEDERIRKELLSFFKERAKYTEDSTFNGLSSKEIIAWLEKLKDCEIIKKDWFEHLKQSWYKEGFIDGKYAKGEYLEWTPNDAAILNELLDFLENGTMKLQHDLTLYANWLKKQFSPLEKQAEQKPVEEVNGEDYGIDGLWHAVRILERTLGEVEGYQSDDGILEHKAAITAVKKLKEQKPVEWSEEDEKFLGYAIKAVHNMYVGKDKSSTTDIYIKTANWLNSLNPQKQWKPSDEQMEFLKKCIEAYNEVTFPTEVRVLSSLYNDLKKL